MRELFYIICIEGLLTLILPVLAADGGGVRSFGDLAASTEVPVRSAISLVAENTKVAAGCGIPTAAGEPNWLLSVLLKASADVLLPDPLSAIRGKKSSQAKRILAAISENVKKRTQKVLTRRCVERHILVVEGRLD